MKISDYIDWVNTQKWLKSAARDWLTDNVVGSNSMRILDVIFHSDYIWIQVENKTHHKKSIKIKIEDVLKYVPDENI